ncbi:MAG: efflux RND transporter periplasmic adaptor subunit [Ignavibacteriales bacterium]|nr:MAG: efflux RND transporter periplasmic adaptor subunit [Ignavibacteriales bacterium]
MKNKINFLVIEKLFTSLSISTTVAIVILLMSINCADQQASGGDFSMPPMPVEVANVTAQTVSDKFEAVGTIEAIEEITVVSEIDASVISLPFDEGSYIKQGDLIAQLDDSQLSAEFIRAEALFTQSKSTYERVKSIVEQNAGTPQDLDDALASLKVAEANLKLAKARLDKTKITAPFNGLIGSRRVSVGSFLRTGQTITELANLNEIRINFSAPERFLSQLKRGADVIVSSPVYPGHQVRGRIIAIEPVINPDTRTARIVARVQNPGQKFRAGMSANVSVILSERNEALTIPMEAIFESGNQSFVFVVNADSTVKRVAVTTGLQMPDVVEVLQGLENGMQVIKAGHQKLFEGAKVMPVNLQSQPMNQ